MFAAHQANDKVSHGIQTRKAGITLILMQQRATPVKQNISNSDNTMPVDIL